MDMKLAENIRTFRKERSLTQEQLSEVLGVTAGAVYKWEAGLSVPDIQLIMEMADFFDTSVDVLLGYEMKDNRLDATVKRLQEYRRQKDRAGLAEADRRGQDRGSVGGGLPRRFHRRTSTRGGAGAASRRARAPVRPRAGRRPARAGSSCPRRPSGAAVRPNPLAARPRHGTRPRRSRHARRASRLRRSASPRNAAARDAAPHRATATALSPPVLPLPLPPSSGPSPWSFLPFPPCFPSIAPCVIFPFPCSSSGFPPCVLRLMRAGASGPAVRPTIVSASPRTP